MSIESKLSGEEIIRKAGVCPRPEVYSGRGAVLSDLNSQHLEKIYDLILKNHGENAADNFIDMVEGIKVLSATDFLVTLYSLESCGWKYDSEKVKSDAVGGILVRKDSNGNYDEIHGELSMMTALTSGGRNETESIRRPFLRNHGKKSNKIVYDSNGVPIYFF